MIDNNLRHHEGARGADAVWALCPDLVFASRIRGTGAELGVPVAVVRSAAHLLEDIAGAGAEAGSRPSEEEAREGGRLLALVDLASARDGVEAIAAIKARFPSVTVIAFAPHVATERIRSARAAGADRVLARSAFVAQLPEILAGG